MTHDRRPSRLAHWPPPNRATVADKTGTRRQSPVVDERSEGEKVRAPKPRWHLASNTRPRFDD